MFSRGAQRSIVARAPGVREWRGERLESVDDVLVNYPGEALVAARDRPHVRSRLVAFVVSYGGSSAGAVPNAVRPFMVGQYETTPWM